MKTVIASMVGSVSASPLGWAVTFVPSIAIVAMQESTTPFPNAIPMLASAVTQFLVTGAIVIGLPALVERLLGKLTIAIALVIWILTGASRGIVGGLFAYEFAGVQPQFLERIIVWVILSVVSIPIISFLFAQLGTRRELLRRFTSLAAQLADERRRGRLSSTQLELEVVTAVREAVAPLVDEVRLSLANAAEHAKEEELAPISGRLESLAKRTESIISANVTGDSEPADVLSRAPWTFYTEGLAFDRSRPALTAMLTTVTMFSIYGPEAFRVAGFEALQHEVPALLAGGIVLYLCLLIIKHLHVMPRLVSSLPMLATLVAGATAIGVLLLSTSHQLETQQVFVAITLPAMFVIVGATLSSSIGLAQANDLLAPSVDSLRVELGELRERSRKREEFVANQVNQLMHGPILGRLSACVMALNFYLAEPHLDSGARWAATMDGVLTHLDRISADFDELGLSH